MAILRSTDGRFYDIPDEQLDEQLVPGEEVKQKLRQSQASPTPAGGASQPASFAVPGAGQVVIQIFTSPEDGAVMHSVPGQQGEEDSELTAHGYCWRRNSFSNCWRRNCWRNCYRR